MDNITIYKDNGKYEFLSKCDDLVSSLQGPDSKVEGCVILSDETNITHENAAKLADALKKNTTLKSLSLDSYAETLKDADAAMIINSLPKSLEKIGVRYSTSFGEKGTAALTNFIRDNANLKSLDLDTRQIQGIEMKDFVEVIKTSNVSNIKLVPESPENKKFEEAVKENHRKKTAPEKSWVEKTSAGQERSSQGQSR